jgi:hypothetical protein
MYNGGSFDDIIILIRWAPEPEWTKGRSENSLPYWDSNFDSSVVQLATSRCTDWAIPTLWNDFKNINFRLY